MFGIYHRDDLLKVFEYRFQAVAFMKENTFGQCEVRKLSDEEEKKYKAICLQAIVDARNNEVERLTAEKKYASMKLKEAQREVEALEHEISQRTRKLYELKSELGVA